MPFENPAQRLRDIGENIDVVEEFTARLNRDDFAADRKTLHCTLRRLQQKYWRDFRVWPYGPTFYATSRVFGRACQASQRCFMRLVNRRGSSS